MKKEIAAESMIALVSDWSLDKLRVEGFKATIPGTREDAIRQACYDELEKREAEAFAKRKSND